LNNFLKLMLVFILSSFFLVACGDSDIDTSVKEKMKNESKIQTNMAEKVSDFEFVDQDGVSGNTKDYEGEYWIADLIFTNCTTVCIPMTSNMKKLQDKMIEEDLTNIELVSFSVDPDYDTTDVLTEYADDYEADLGNWSFVTGYEFDEIKELSIKSFRSMLQEPLPGDDQVTHGTRFFLINPQGEVIKNYDGMNGKVVDEIINDLKKL